MGAIDCCNGRLEATTISEILHLFGQGNLTFVREKSGNEVCRVFWGALASGKYFGNTCLVGLR